MTADSVLQAAGVLTYGEIVRFQYFHFARRNWLLAAAVVPVFLFALVGVVGVICTGDVDRMVNPGLDWAGLLIVTALVCASPFWSSKKQRSSQLWLREAIRYHFLADRMRVEGPSFSTEIAWPLVQGIYETKTLFVIYISKRSGYILPKRFFWGEESAIRRFREFALARLTKPAKLHGIGFVGSRL